MCGNYERQLQKLQDENQKFQNLASNLQVALDQEKVRAYLCEPYHNPVWIISVINLLCITTWMNEWMKTLLTLITL